VKAMRRLPWSSADATRPAPLRGCAYGVLLVVSCVLLLGSSVVLQYARSADERDHILAVAGSIPLPPGTMALGVRPRLAATYLSPGLAGPLADDPPWPGVDTLFAADGDRAQVQAWYAANLDPSIWRQPPPVRPPGAVSFIEFEHVCPPSDPSCGFRLTVYQSWPVREGSDAAALFARYHSVFVQSGRPYGYVLQIRQT
jgi:hypothetical protein